MQSRSWRMHGRFAALLFALAALSGCGGGGTGAPPPGTITGSVTKGPVSGATVQAFAVTGGFVGAVLATTTTAADGSFTLSVGEQSVPVFLQATGGTYVEEATGAAAAMVDGDTLGAALPTMAPGTSLGGVQLTPLTGMAHRMAARLPGGLNDANIATANAAIGRYFGVDDIARTHPIDPLAAGSAAGATQGAINYGMVLAAMSQYARSAGFSVSSRFVAALMNDAADGVLDGQDGSATLTILRDPRGGGLPQASAGSTGLAAALVDFANSPLNVSGAGAAAVTPLAQQLAASGGRLR